MWSFVLMILPYAWRMLEDATVYSEYILVHTYELFWHIQRRIIKFGIVDSFALYPRDLVFVLFALIGCIATVCGLLLFLYNQCIKDVYPQSPYRRVCRILWLPRTTTTTALTEASLKNSTVPTKTHESTSTMTTTKKTTTPAATTTATAALTTNTAMQMKENYHHPNGILTYRQQSANHQQPQQQQHLAQ